MMTHRIGRDAAHDLRFDLTARPEPLWQRVLGIALCLLLYVGMMAMVAWMMISYPIDH